MSLNEKKQLVSIWKDEPSVTIIEQINAKKSELFTLEKNVNPDTKKSANPDTKKMGAVKSEIKILEKILSDRKWKDYTQILTNSASRASGSVSIILSFLLFVLGTFFGNIFDHKLSSIGITILHIICVIISTLVIGVIYYIHVCFTKRKFDIVSKSLFEKIVTSLEKNNELNNNLEEQIEQEKTQYGELIENFKNIEKNFITNIENSQSIQSNITDSSKKISETNQNILTITNNFTEKFKNLDETINKSEEIKKYLELHKQEKSRILTEDEYYKYLESARELLSQNNISSTIYLTNFSKEMGGNNDNSDEEYFNKEINYCKNNPKIIIKRIITVRSKQKLIALKNMINNINNNKIENLQIAYLNTKWLHAKNFHERDCFYLPKLIGSQVNGDEVIIMNPMTARISANPRNGSPPEETKRINKHIYIKNQEIADIFASYHNILWSEITKFDNPNNIGCILYEYKSEDDNPKTINENIWKIIEEQMSTEEQPPLTPKNNIPEG